jgi:hypothetical protein
MRGIEGLHQDVCVSSITCVLRCCKISPTLDTVSGRCSSVCVSRMKREQTLFIYSCPRRPGSTTCFGFVGALYVVSDGSDNESASTYPSHLPCDHRSVLSLSTEFACHALHARDMLNRDLETEIKSLGPKSSLEAYRGRG